jgi:putative ABC transport system permease protein
MNPRLKKALNDLWVNPSRTLLAIFALTIGLWGIGSILVSYVILKNDLNENFTRTDPFHVALTSKDFAKLDLATFRQRPEIESAEFRDLSFQRIEVFPNQWLPLWLFGLDDFENFNLTHVYSEEGAKIPPHGAVLLERNGRLVSNLATGSIAHVRVGSKVLQVPIAGIDFDPAQAPATQDAFIYAYADKNTYSEISGEPANQRLIFRLRNVETKQDVQAATNIILADFRNHGFEIDSVNIPTPNQHPHQFQLNTLLAFQGSIGLLGFLMGAILVSQLIGAILAQQIRQIGVLKAIGATAGQVMSIYLFMVLILGVLASILAIPLAVLSGYAFAGFVAKILNFNILTKALPLWLYAGLITCGLVLPMLFALPALLKGVRVSVKNALSDYGINSATSNPRKATATQWPLPFGIQLALRNVLRRKKRLATTVATIALGVAIFSSGFNVRQSLFVFLEDTKNAMKYDVQLVLKEQVAREKALAPFHDLKNVLSIETWNGGRGRLQSSVVSTNNGIGIIALPYDTDLVKMDVIKGRWLQHSNDLEIVMNQVAAEGFGEPVEVGKQYPINLNGKQVQVRLVGIVKEFDVAKIYIDKEQYDKTANPEHLINSLMFVAQDRGYKQTVALKQDIEKALRQTDLNVFYVMSQAERAKIVYDHLNIILTLFTVLSSLVLVISTLGMAASTGTNIMERTREIGVMRAIGATPKIIYGLFVAEGAVVSIVGIALGLLLSLPLSFYASKFFGNLILGHGISLPFAFSQIGFVITLAIILVFGWLASRIPARKAISISNREALSYE